MITLTTAVPGAGKTLRVVGELLAIRDDERRKREKDPDFKPRLIFTNINGLDPSLECCRIEDGRDWNKVPEGSLIVLDECQEFFPPRSSGAKVPDYVQDFAVHRHRGLDIWLMTQHPRLIDFFIRDLVGYHRHGYRPYGLSYAIWSEFQCCDNNPPMPQKPLKKKVNHDKRVFGLYKSSVEHTHKAKHPWAVYFKLAAALLVVSGSAYAAYSQLDALNHKSVVPSHQVTEKASSAVNESSLKPATKVESKPETVAVAPAPVLEKPIDIPPAVPELVYQGWAKSGDDPILILCNKSIDSTCANPQSVYKLSNFGAWKLKNGVLELFLSINDDRPSFVVNDPKLVQDARELGINV